MGGMGSDSEYELYKDLVICPIIPSGPVVVVLDPYPGKLARIVVNASAHPPGSFTEFLISASQSVIIPEYTQTVKSCASAPSVRLVCPLEIGPVLDSF